MHLKKVTSVNDPRDDPVHVHRLARVGLNERINAFIGAHFNFRIRLVWRILGVIGRQETQELLNEGNGFRVGIHDKVRIAADRGVHVRAAHILGFDFAATDRLDDLRPGDEHLPVASGHDDEVHQRRRIRGATSTRTTDDSDLRDDAGQLNVAVEDLAIAGQGVDAFLDSSPSGILEA